MKLYRKKPVVIEAMQFLPDIETLFAISKWGLDNKRLLSTGLDDDGEATEILIFTLEGRLKALPGDWIIKGVNGEFYPCKPDIFEKTYEAVE